MTEQPAKKIEENKKKRESIFDGPDGKVLATGDMFRGPYTGVSSDFDINNPGRNLPKVSPEEEIR